MARDRRVPPTPFVFTFVRSPVAHLVSGYAEVSARAAGKLGRRDLTQYDGAEERAWYSFTSQRFGSRERARAFLRDFARGRLRPHLPQWDYESIDIHAYPQVCVCLGRRATVT